MKMSSYLNAKSCFGCGATSNRVKFYPGGCQQCAGLRVFLPPIMYHRIVSVKFQVNVNKFYDIERRCALCLDIGHDVSSCPEVEGAYECLACYGIGHTANACPDLEGAYKFSDFESEKYLVAEDNCSHENYSYDYSYGCYFCDLCGMDIEDA